MTSESVGWAWQMRARSSLAAPNSMATTASAISSGIGADHMHAEDAVAIGVGEHLDEAGGFPDAEGAAIGQEWDLPAL